MTEKKLIKKGTLLVMSSGEYSSYGLDGTAMAAMDFYEEDIDEEWEKYAAAKGWHGWDRESRYFNWFINTKGYAIEVQYHEIHAL